MIIRESTGIKTSTRSEAEILGATKGIPGYPANRPRGCPGRQSCMLFPLSFRFITFSTLATPVWPREVEKVMSRKLKGNNIHDCHGHPCGQCGRFFLLPGGRGAAQRACNRRNRTFCPLAELSRGEGNFLCIFEPDDRSEAAALAAVHVGRPKQGSWAMDIASRPWLN